MLLAVALLLVAAALGGLWVMLRMYPYDLQPVIEEAAGKYALDPLFVAAVIRTESNFKTDARSSAGAVGLMQIMPDTGQWIAGKNKWDFSQEMLLDGKYSIEAGCWYLDYLTKEFGGNTTMALAAYNAGDGKVRKWVAEGRFNQGKYDIPFKETRIFVKKVLDAYDKYKLLYGRH